METILRDGMLLAMGNPLLDISVVVDDKLLEKYGLKPNDAILAEEKHMPLYKELTDNETVEYIAGGSAQNTVRVAQWLLGKPNVCAYMGCVGKDQYSDIIAKKARDDGVLVLYQYTTERPTGTCAVLVTDNGTKRSLCANLAAAECFTVDHLQNSEVQKVLNNAEFYYSSSFFLTMEAFPYVDIIFGNETEALTFAKENNLETEDIKEIALKMTRLPKQNPNRPRVVVITQGHLPVILAENGKVKEYPVDFIPPEKVIDTNGAGDAFVGGFLAQLIKGEPFDKCMKCAIWAAAQIIQRSGCTFEGKPSFS